MKLPRQIENLEDDYQLCVLEFFGRQVRKILKEYKEKRQLGSIAKRLGFHPSRFTEMITKNGKGEYKRRITPYYLAKFFDGGVMDVHQVLGRRKLENLSGRSRLFLRG